MAGISSLLKSAQSAQQKAREYEDAIAAYQWDNSTKSYADYVAYEEYLGVRQTAANDPAKQLSYQKKVDTARSAYISNEIQRQSINVVEGATSNANKYNRMVDLYHTAASAGQDDLAQSLRLQLDNLSVTIQNEQLAGISSNREAAQQMTKELDAQVTDAVNQVKDNAKYALEQYSLLGPDRFMEETGSDIFSLLANMVNSQDPNNPGMVQIYDQASRLTPDPVKQRDYQMKFNGIAQGEATGIKLPGVGSVSYQDLADQAYATSIGQTLFDTVQTGEVFFFVKNETTGYAWGRDENGNYKLMPVYNPKQNLTSNVADPSKKDGKFSYETLLKNAGFEVTKGGDSLTVRNDGKFDAAGIPRGQQVQLYVDLNGNLQTVRGDKAYSLGFDSSGNFKGIQAELPNSINLMPGGSGANAARFSRFNSRFFAGKDLSGVAAGTIGLVDTASPFARPGPLPAPMLSTIQGAAGAALTQSSAAVQPTAPGTVAQSGVSPIGLPANTKLTLAKPQPLPQVVVAKTTPLPKVSVAKPAAQPKLSVAKPPKQPKLTF